MPTPLQIPPRVAPAVPRPAAPPRLRSEELFRGSHELVIEHRGEEYRLRWTRNDKLILNK